MPQDTKKRDCHKIRGPYHLKKDLRKSWNYTWQFLKRQRWTILISFLAVVLIGLFIHPHDEDLLAVIQARGKGWNHGLQDFASQVNFWCDFGQLNVICFLGIWIFGYLRRLRWVQRLAFASFMAAVLAGITCNALRLTTGRPRPYVDVMDGFYWLPGTTKGWDYHSFPSGHTSTAFGTSVPVATAGGIYAAPALLIGGSVGWARMYKNKHYPTDVLIGAYFGIVFGIASGWQLHRVRRRLTRRRRSLANR